MSASETITALRQLWDSSSVPEWTGTDQLRLKVAVLPVPFALLRNLSVGDVHASLASDSLQLSLDSGAEGQVPVGEQVRLRVPRILGHLVVASGLKDLLGIAGAQTSEPVAYVLCGKDAPDGWFSHVSGGPLENPTQAIQQYHQAVRLWGVLTNQAQHTDMTTGALLFFGLRRTEIVPGFELDDLSDEIAIAEIERFVGDTDRQKTRAEIFSAVLSEFLRDQKSEAAFRWVLRGSKLFARRLKEGLAIYLAEHSPEKLAEKARDAALGLSEKLEKIISGLEAKSLSVPAAVLLAVKEVEQGAGWTLLNGIIVVSALSYAATMTLVHRSQVALLNQVSVNLQSTKKELTDKGLDAKNPVLTGAFASLETRCLGAWRGSWLMCIFSWVPIVCVLVSMWLGTPKPSAQGPVNDSKQTPPIGQQLKTSNPQSPSLSATGGNLDGSVVGKAQQPNGKTSNANPSVK